MTKLPMDKGTLQPRMAHDHASTPRLPWRLGIFAASAAGFLAIMLWFVQQNSLREAAALNPTVAAPELPPPARVLATLRQMKLVTAKLNTVVATASTDQSWRGDVRAVVTAPAALLYGVDLAKLEPTSVRFGPLSGTYVVQLPPPERIATEVFPTQEQADVDVGWLRTRRGAGEYHLGLARRQLADDARALRLSPADEQQVRAITREQVTAALRRLLGPLASVRVAFEDEPTPAPSLAPSVLSAEPGS